jgi:hypothetical protein
MLNTLRRRVRTKTNPVFYPDRVKAVLAHDPERLERIFTAPASVDLVAWNVFASMDSDPDREYLSALLQPFAGSDLRAPVRVTLWTGRHREPLLRPSPAYVRHIRDKAGDDPSLEDFARPIEAPVRIESPAILSLVDTTIDAMPRGAGGRDRLVELVDAGLEHARYLSTALAVCVVYRSGTPPAATLSARVNDLRSPARLAAALPWRERLPDLRLREVSWQELLRTWERERGSYRLFGQPVRAFLEYAAALGLR